MKTPQSKLVTLAVSMAATLMVNASPLDAAKPSVVIVHGAFAPDVGQTSGEQGDGFPAAPGLSQLKTDSSGFISLRPASMVREFAQDLPPEQTAVMAATQGPIGASAFEDRKPSRRGRRCPPGTSSPPRCG